MPPAELRRAPVVEGNQGSRLADGQAVLVRRGRRRRCGGGPALFRRRFVPTVVFPVCLFYQMFSTGVGGVGQQSSGDVGLGHREFRLVGRYRARRHAGFPRCCFSRAQHWRTTTIGRAAEAMTVFSVMMAGLVPGASTSAAPGSTGSCSRSRTPNGMWPQFRSPLMWDVFAVNTYLDGVIAVLVHAACDS